MRGVTRITRRQAAQAFNLGAPLDMALRDVPEKRERKEGERREWHFQRECVTYLRKIQQFDKALRFMAPGCMSTRLTEVQRYFAHAQGYSAGWLDLWLFYEKPGLFKIRVVELKMGDNKPTPEQRDWLGMMDRLAGFGVDVECRVISDDLKEFCDVVDKLRA